ncbi:MAG: hypothetical protein KDK55_06425 [Chlamydiia bacterium]|nr:hypothetical protein [Chlamydiia bacterium]
MFGLFCICVKFATCSSSSSVAKKITKFSLLSDVITGLVLVILGAMLIGGIYPFLSMGTGYGIASGIFGTLLMGTGCLNLCASVPVACCDRSIHGYLSSA